MSLKKSILNLKKSYDSTIADLQGYAKSYNAFFHPQFVEHWLLGDADLKALHEAII
jgi:hypothetical protein